MNHQLMMNCIESNKSFKVPHLAVINFMKIHVAAELKLRRYKYTNGLAATISYFKTSPLFAKRYSFKLARVVSDTCRYYLYNKDDFMHDSLEIELYTKL
jgi:hypothetical protein